MQKRYPRTLLEFEHWFRSEDACREYLIRLRWPNGFSCPACAYQRAWRVRRGAFQCARCRKDVSVTAGTIFQDSKMPLRLWFRAMWLLTHQKTGMSALGLQRTLGLGSYRTAWSCLHKLRRAMIRPGREALSGEVEIDETFVGGHEKGGGRRHVGKKSLVIVAAEVRGKGTGRIRLASIPDSSKEHLLAFIQEMVALGSIVVTDGLPVYANVASLGYVHRPRIPETPEQAVKLLPRVHQTAALLKRWLLGVHHGSFSKRQVDHYLSEFTFRFNRRKSPDRGMVFYRLVQQAVAIDHVPVADIQKGA